MTRIFAAVPRAMEMPCRNRISRFRWRAAATWVNANRSISSSALSSGAGSASARDARYSVGLERCMFILHLEKWRGPVLRSCAILRRSSELIPGPHFHTASKLQCNTVPRVRRQAHYRAWVHSAPFGIPSADSRFGRIFFSETGPKTGFSVSREVHPLKCDGKDEAAFRIAIRLMDSRVWQRPERPWRESRPILTQPRHWREPAPAGVQTARRP